MPESLRDSASLYMDYDANPMTDAVQSFCVSLGRHAFTLRDVARPLEIWRACQDVAVEVTINAGFTPEYFRQTGTAFIVFQMAVEHHREAIYGEALEAQTWLSSFRRRTICDREIRIGGDAGSLASATQRWVHVEEATARLKQASVEMQDALPVYQGSPSVTLPDLEHIGIEGRSTTFDFRVWHTAMDPLGHVNHPTYIEWCDEALAQELNRIGVDPLDVVALAESLDYKAPVGADDEVRVTTQLVGRSSTAVEFAQSIESGGVLCAKSRLIRTLVNGGADALFDAWSTAACESS